ncbi:MAG: phosphatidylserine decarboxylase [Spirochaetes bacterium]|nr:phosphatidylserine decarboxylase [Spirochaetota bacterium]
MKTPAALKIFLFRLLPKSLISRIFGYIALIPLPQSLLRGIIRWYSSKYGVINEYIVPPGGFRNLDQFFTRGLAKGSHPIEDSGAFAVSPVDARVDQLGDIRDMTIMQAKGIGYSLQQLVPSDMFRKFLWGKFITLYLSPGDYHRIHAPVSGTIAGYYNLPGTLFTVQDWMTQGLRDLFVKNERVITYIESKAGIVGVCKVGAMNVGKITLAYCDFQTNRTFRRRREVLYPPAEQTTVKAGDELGIFHLGSTVIILFQKDAIDFKDLKPGDRIRMGARIGKLRITEK